MSDWKIPLVHELERDRAPPAWVPIVIFIIVMVSGFIITVMNWPTGKPSMSGAFFGYALGVPLLVAGVLCALVYVPWELGIESIRQWNYRCREHHTDWRCWAQAHVAIIDSVVLTPEVDLSERMLGLDGTPLQHAGEAIALQTSAAVTGIPVARPSACATASLPMLEFTSAPSEGTTYHSSPRPMPLMTKWVPRSARRASRQSLNGSSRR
ncbi:MULTISPECIES: hypothetical protein [unclassified Caballeronia]|uniref:hypothetical protein n=1 Tax=unclassified Caballeronia TaxID=2646786 RepID=UPI001F32FB3E|nr:MULTISPECIES: hypothetical protein [unclassified Caballeronia]MCE4542198.1 hypothetical protein [Caballeronia sp. PC1]MCE4568755.1 hypothetical protein [Caballeronia sp. CLC5]